jgi:hypothetical protein
MEKPQINVGMATMRELWNFHDRYALPADRDRKFRTREQLEQAVRGCLARVWADKTNLTEREQTMSEIAKALAPARPRPLHPVRMSTSLSMKLDRRIVCLDTKEEFRNAHVLWKAHPEWMSSGQQDRLTKTLYEAAKRGERAIVEVNGRDFMLINVEVKVAV